MFLCCFMYSMSCIRRIFNYRNIFKLNYFACYVILLQILDLIRPVENNLHVYDGPTTAEIIGGDVFFEIINPMELRYTYRIRPAIDFGVPFNESYSMKNVPLVPMEPNHGCTNPKNIDEIEGSVALVQRGQCTFKHKTLLAEQAGARAIIITDEELGQDEYFIDMIDDSNSDDAHIPAGFLLGKNGYMIRYTLNKLNERFAVINLPVNLTFTPVHEISQPPWLEW